MKYNRKNIRKILTMILGSIILILSKEIKVFKGEVIHEKK